MKNERCGTSDKMTGKKKKEKEKKKTKEKKLLGQ